MLDRQPSLEGPRLGLRPLCRDDWGALYALAADPLIWEQHPAHDRWREDVFAAFFDDALAKQGALVIIERASGKVIGSSRYQGLKEADGGSIEIGWTFLARSHWGGEANRELKRLMLTHALASVAQCRFVVGQDNHRSRRAMEKIGGRLIDHSEIRAMAGGALMRHVTYVITREDFAAGPLAQV